MTIFDILIIIALITILLLIILIAYLRIKRSIYKYYYNKKNKRLIAFFHPFCNSGGGGERVLWKMIECLLLNKDLNLRYDITIYSGELSTSKYDILANVKCKFNIDLEAYHDNINICTIKSRFLLQSKWYPIATLICQSIASTIVGMECLLRFSPDIYIDTTGEAFIYPLAVLLGGCTVIPYVHYPTISTDMLNKIIEQRPSYNNNNIISSSRRITYLKQIYYRIFQQLYTFVGSFSSVVMVNSSWTYSHIISLWRFNSDTDSNRRIIKVYPPCNTESLVIIPLANDRERIILSLGQFRPEKDQLLQLRAFAELLNNNKYQDVIMVMVGSTRNINDELLLNNLKEEAKALNIISNVHFMVNLSYGNLLEYLSKASIGIHTMWNEHFGISIVEMMAAGVIVVAHNSGGPKLDIVVSIDDHITGYLATTINEYSKALGEILDLNEESDYNIRYYARLQSQKFSDEIFIKSIEQIFENL